jgi:hypothetical protein
VSVLSGEVGEPFVTRNRLPYETIAGQASEADTFAQLLEYLRLAEEAAYLLGHLRRAQDDKLLGQGWLAIGEMLKMTQTNVTRLATKKLRDSAGWKQ